MRARAWLVACGAALAAGCTALPAPRPVPPPAAGTPANPAAAEARQRLYRVQYDGPAGHGGLRLVLRLAAPERFQIAASDSLGRAVWSLDHAPGTAALVDHRERLYCVTDSDLRMPEVALAPLPLTALPRVLAGRLPVPPPAGTDPAEPDWRDGQGRRWTARLEESEPASWTLWEEGEPRLWWLRQPRGGILSHRDGSQFRWRGVVDEPLAGGSLTPFTPPDGYERGACVDGSGAPGSPPGDEVGV